MTARHVHNFKGKNYISSNRISKLRELLLRDIWVFSPTVLVACELWAVQMGKFRGGGGEGKKKKG